MSTDMLIRKRIKAPVIVDNDAQRFAQECSEQLDYHALHRELTSQVIRPLGQVLRDLQIEPFDLKSVKDYKTSRVLVMNTDWMTAIPAVILFLAATGVIIWAWSTLGVVEALIISVGTIVGWFFASALGVVAISPFTKTAQWQTKWLPCYDGRVPEFALQTALDIRAQCPEAAFFIDELRIEQRSADPFLAVELDAEKYYIEVWNEPGFKARREA